MITTSKSIHNNSNNSLDLFFINSIDIDNTRGAESTRVRKRALGEIFWIWGNFWKIVKWRNFEKLLSGKFFEKLLSGEIFGNLLIARSFLKVTFFHVKKVTKCHDSIHKFLAFVLLTISLVGLFFFLHVFFSS